MLILNESKVKYDRLDALLANQLIDLRFSEQVNIIVDLKEVIKKFFRPDMVPTKFIKEEIASDIINIIAHYRNYFYKKNKYTSFYFLYSYSKCDELLAIMPDYKKEYYAKYFDSTENKDKIDIISAALNGVRNVVGTIPHSIFIDTSKHDELTYARSLIEGFPKNQMTIILSNDEVLYQLLAKNVFLINLKGIKSELVTMDNAIQVLMKKDDAPAFSSNLIPLLIALSGNKKYSFKGITHVALIKGAKIIETLIDRKIVMDIDSVEVPLDFAKLNPKKDKLDSLVFGNSEQIIRTYALVRNDENYHKNKLAIENEIKGKISLTKTYSYFLDLNAKVFTMYPLQLDMLLKGEKL